MRLIQTRYVTSSRPMSVADTPNARKMSEKPSTKSSACTNATRRARGTSSSVIPVMKVM